MAPNRDGRDASPKPARQRFVNGSSRAFGAGSTPRRRGQPLGRLPQAARRARHAGACKSTDTVAKRRGRPTCKVEQASRLLSPANCVRRKRGRRVAGPHTRGRVCSPEKMSGTPAVRPHRFPRFPPLRLRVSLPFPSIRVFLVKIAFGSAFIPSGLPMLAGYVASLHCG
jgi:hypothetical protein